MPNQPADPAENYLRGLQLGHQIAQARASLDAENRRDTMASQAAMQIHQQEHQLAVAKMQTAAALHSETMAMQKQKLDQAAKETAAKTRQAAMALTMRLQNEAAKQKALAAYQDKALAIKKQQADTEQKKAEDAQRNAATKAATPSNVQVSFGSALGPQGRMTMAQNDPRLNQIYGTNAPAGLGTNYPAGAAPIPPPAAAPAASTAAPAPSGLKYPPSVYTRANDLLKTGITRGQAWKQAQAEFQNQAAKSPAGETDANPDI